jgi:antimicrobial peptide system SdpA family protein
MWPRSAPGQPPPDPGPADQRLGRAVVILATLAAVIVVYVLYAALPATAFQLPFSNPRAVRLLVPEGWAFFTKSPLSPDPTAYGFRGGHWHPLNAGPQATLSNVMGLDRLARSQGTELAILMQQIPPGSWSPCRQAPVACLSRLTVQRTVLDTSTHRTVCGDVGLVMQQVLPWAWRNLRTVMPSTVVRVTVTC